MSGESRPMRHQEARLHPLLGKRTAVLDQPRAEMEVRIREPGYGLWPRWRVE